MKGGLAAVAAGCLAGSRLGAKTEPSAIRHALWVWKTRPADFPALAAFVARNDIDTVFLALDQEGRSRLLDRDAIMIRDLRALRSGGCKVFCSTGDPEWVLRSRQMPRALGDLIRIHQSRFPFDGFHLDVEPNAHALWKSERKRLLEGFLEFMAAARASISAPLDAALNPIFARLSIRHDIAYLSDLVRHIDSVSLMAYRDKPERAIEWAAPAIRVLDSEGRPWRMGVLVHASDEPGTSFHGSPPEAFRSSMGILDERLRSLSPHYVSLAFEDFHGLRQLVGQS